MEELAVEKQKGEEKSRESEERRGEVEQRDKKLAVYTHTHHHSNNRCPLLTLPHVTPPFPTVCNSNMLRRRVHVRRRWRLSTRSIHRTHIILASTHLSSRLDSTLLSFLQDGTEQTQGGGAAERNLPHGYGNNSVQDTERLYIAPCALPRPHQVLRLLLFVPLSCRKRRKGQPRRRSERRPRKGAAPSFNLHAYALQP